MSIILNFFLTHFTEAILIAALGLLSKVLIKYFGNDRAIKIKETIIIAMLWAEETFGLGTGDQKWTAAWNKLIELLQTQGIRLNNKEISTVTTLMKANIPEINSLVYSSLPEESLIKRAPDIKPFESEKLIKKLREKYPTQEE